MNVMKDTIQGVIIVEYCSYQSSHSIKLAHLPIPSDTKHKRVGKLHNGESFKRILDDVRDTMTIGEIGCDQLYS